MEKTGRPDIELPRAPVIAAPASPSAVFRPYLDPSLGYVD
jgi:hypothetical protein